MHIKTINHMIEKSIVRKGIIALIIGIAVTAVIMMFTDVKTSFGQLMQLSLKQALYIICLVPINYFIKYIRYRYYLRLMGYNVKLVDEVFSLLSSFVMVITPGKLGETLLRGYLLQKCNYKIGMSSIVSLTIADRLTEGIAMAVLVLITISSVGNGVNILAVIIVGMGLILLGMILQNKKIVRNVLSKMDKIKKLAPVAKGIYTAYDVSQVIYRPKAFWVSTLLGIVSWCCEGGVVYFTAVALGNPITFSQSVFAVSLSGIFAAISMIPGGIGIADGTTLGILLLYGMSKDVAGTITVVSRFSVMWLGVVVGGISLMIWRKKWAKIAITN